MLDENAVTTVTSSILSPRNGWVTGDCQRQTFVWAGGFTGHSAGIFVFERDGNWPRDRLRDVYIVVPHSGAVEITRAPLGPEVVTSAQRHGELQFTSERGITGAVLVGEDTATLSTGEVIRGTRNYPPGG